MKTASFTNRLLSPWERSSRTHRVGGLVESRVGVDAVAKRKGSSSAASSQRPDTLLTELLWIIRISTGKINLEPRISELEGNRKYGQKKNLGMQFPSQQSRTAFSQVAVEGFHEYPAE